MTLRLSSPISENRRQSTATTLANDSVRPELRYAPTDPISTGLDTGLAEPAAATALPAIDALAPNRRQLKHPLSKALLQNPQAIKLLAARLSDANGEGMDEMPPDSGNARDYDIVQDYRFVQPDARRFVSLPAQPISVADQIEQQFGIDLRQQSRLDEYRRQLHEARQQMFTAHTGLVAFVASQYKTTSFGLSPVGFATSNQANRLEKPEASPAS